MSTDALPPGGIAPPVMVLCRQCLHYVFEGTRDCPHCGGNARESGERYRDGGYLAIEAMRHIDRLRDAIEARRTRDDAKPIER